MDVETIVEEFIEKNFLYKKDTKKLSGNESLLNSGLLDSTGILELVAFMESQFSIEVSDEEVVPEHFETINDIVAFINTKRRSEVG